MGTRLYGKTVDRRHAWTYAPLAAETQGLSGVAINMLRFGLGQVAAQEAPGRLPPRTRGGHGRTGERPGRDAPDHSGRG
ncbi:hypothetical protein GCM10020367_72650 [Streptomyces sannanensis]|uniref:Transposase DDE domain-containing protein n=1 Tax=Streptomyces sannanensis TaxID=285536 RepID=A0ABP6SNQ3_9ACTN